MIAASGPRALTRPLQFQFVHGCRVARIAVCSVAADAMSRSRINVTTDCNVPPRRGAADRKRAVTPLTPRRPSGQSRATQAVGKRRKLLAHSQCIDLDSEEDEAVSESAIESIPVTPLPVRSARASPRAARSGPSGHAQREWMLDSKGFITYTPSLPASTGGREDQYWQDLLTFVHRVLWRGICVCCAKRTSSFFARCV